jgi:hypothetical protein
MPPKTVEMAEYVNKLAVNNRFIHNVQMMSFDANHLAYIHALNKPVAELVSNFLNKEKFKSHKILKCLMSCLNAKCSYHLTTQSFLTLLTKFKPKLPLKHHYFVDLVQKYFCALCDNEEKK